jgi:hypothetical protein
VDLNVSSRFLNYATRKKWQIDAGALDTNILVIPLFYGERAWLHPVKRLNHRVIQVTVLEVSCKERVMRRIISYN